VVGDRFEAATFVHNTESAPVDAWVTPEVDGEARAPIRVRVPAKGEARVAEWIEVSRAGTMEVRFEARSDRSRVEVGAAIEVAPRARSVRASAVGAVLGERTVTLEIPAAGDREVTLSIATHPFVGLEAALETLHADRDDGTEALASSVLGLASAASMSLDRRARGIGEEELAARLGRTLHDLVAQQQPSGGFGTFTVDDAQDDYLTIYALHALSVAARVGFDLAPGARARAVTALEARIEVTGLSDAPDTRLGADGLAFALRVLAEEGHPDADRTSELYDRRDRLSPYGLAELAMALPPADLRRLTLVSSAEDRVLGGKDGAAHETALRWYDTSARTLGAVLEASVGTDGAGHGAMRLASKLLAARSEASLTPWSTHETSHALEALSAYAAVFTDEGPLDAVVTLDGAPLAPKRRTDALASYVVDGARAGGGKHALRIVSTRTSYFALGGDWLVPLGEADGVARGAVAALHRVLEDESGSPLADGAHVKLGDLVRVRLFLFTEHEAPPFLEIRDPLAGGLAPLDRGHATTARESLDALLGMGPDDDAIDARAHYALRSIGLVSHRAFRPDEAVFHMVSGGEGLRELTYGVRATTVGTFLLRPAEVSALYARSFRARSAMQELIVDP
jgi:uncharacterized protein YfaS (alpha-2-macroglobulin family)